MTTALDIITDALFEIGVAATGQTLSSEDADTGLRYLNRLMGRLSNSRLATSRLESIVVTLNGASSYTLGPGGTPVSQRPLKVVFATATDSQGLEYPVQIVGQQQWDSIPLKSTTGGPPACVWYEASDTNGTVHVYPKADGFTLNLDVMSLIQSYTLSETLTLPQGYEAALVPLLAADMSANFGKPVTPDLIRRSAGAMRAVNRTNYEPVLATIDIAGSGASSNIFRGY